MLTDAELSTIAESPYKADFPLLAANPGLSFLDSAATAQRPAVVLDAERRFYETMNANPLRGLYRLSVEATAAIDDARAHVASFIGAVDDAGKPQGSQIVFTRNASESLNLVARTLGRTVVGPGDDVVISIMEHHSNIIPWQQLCREVDEMREVARLKERDRLRMEDYQVSVNNADTDMALVKEALEKAQPLLDFRDFPFPVRLRHLDLDEQSLVLATQTPPSLFPGKTLTYRAR